MSLVLLFIVTISPCQAPLDVVAVSKAPSPESNPNSPVPVTTTVVYWATV